MKLGIKHSDSVATLLPNQPDTIATYLAVIKLGAILVPLSPDTDNKTLIYILQNTGVKVIVSQDKYINRLLTIKDSLPALKHIIKVGDTKDEETILFHESISISSPVFLPKEITTLDDSAIIIYTSGTVGLPKGAVLTQYNLLVNADNIARVLAYTENTCVLSVLPLYYVNEIVTSILAPMMVGGIIIMTSQFEPTRFAELVAREKINSVNLTPALLQQWHNVAEAFRLPLTNFSSRPRRPDLSEPARLRHSGGREFVRADGPAGQPAGFKYFISGEGALNPDVVKEINNLGSRVIQGYGLSETAGYVTLLSPNLTQEEYTQWGKSPKLSVGSALNNIEIAILDKKGTELPAGKEGEIVIRGHSVMKGYHKMPEVNRDAFKYGWFHTGDIGFYKAGPESRPSFFISGRLKEIINRAGTKIAPAEIESILYEIPGIKWGVILGFDNKWTGEEVGAYIIPEKDSKITEKEVIEYYQTKTGYPKSPKVIVFSKKTPTETSRHLLRQQLRTHFTKWNETKFEQP